MTCQGLGVGGVPLSVPMLYYLSFEVAEVAKWPASRGSREVPDALYIVS